MKKENDKEREGKLALGWWSALQPSSEDGRTGDAGALARLRRAGLIGAMTEAATAQLNRRLGLQERDYVLAALVACVLAHVREHDRLTRVARAAGAPRGEERGKLSPLRFRRLLAARGEQDCLIAFRRLVALLDHRANVVDLAQSLLEWNDAERGDRCRARWAFHYYDADFAAPDEAPEAAPS